MQAAADGRWETARELTIAGRADASHEALDGVVQAADDDVAIEVLWPGQAFVGVRWRSDETSAVDVALDRLRTVLHPPDSAADAWPVETALLALLGTVPSADLELGELGAVNAWASTGPEVLWQRGHGPGEPDLDKLLARRPDLTACSRPVAVELAAPFPGRAGSGSRCRPAAPSLSIASTGDYSTTSSTASCDPAGQWSCGRRQRACRSKTSSRPSTSSHCSPARTNPYDSTRCNDGALSGLTDARTVRTAGAVAAHARSVSMAARA